MRKVFTLLIALTAIFALFSIAFAEGPPAVVAKADMKATVLMAQKAPAIAGSGQMIVHKKALEGGIGGSIVAQKEDGTQLTTATLGIYTKTEPAMTAETVPLGITIGTTSSTMTSTLTTTVMTTTTGTSAALGGRFSGAAQIGTMTTAKAATKAATCLMAEADKVEMTRKMVFA